MTTKNDAINEQPLDDVSAEQQQAAGDTQPSTEPPERELSERDRAMAEIAQQYRDHHGYGDAGEDDEPDAEAAEAAADGDDPEQDPGRQDAGEGGEPDEAAAQDDPLKELGYYRKPDGKLYTTMKVNGQEREVPADQVKAYLQKDLAGDVKLQQAADRERQLTQREQQLRNMEQQLRQQSSHPPEQGDEEIRQQAKTVLSKVWDGDDDAAAEALADFIRSNSSRVDTDQILSEAERRAMSAVEQREAQRQQREWENSTREGLNWLRENHPRVLDDDNLREFVDVRTARMVEARQNGDPEFADMTPRQIIEKAAGEANEWLQQQAQQRAGGDTPGNAREARKRNLKPMPRGMSKQPSQKAPEEPDTSPAAVIARMRESRAVN
ncbi:MAG: hypothetical protein ACQEUM_07270 [Pseudomonadota bacterium]